MAHTSKHTTEDGQIDKAAVQKVLTIYIVNCLTNIIFRSLSYSLVWTQPFSPTLFSPITSIIILCEIEAIAQPSHINLKNIN
ncbi:MAG: hypothetical protein KAF91_26225 [Nostoc sp. TH1S01]|nr:hypothetical protein [Nostoc sp. TH1S01]